VVRRKEGVTEKSPTPEVSHRKKEGKSLEGLCEKRKSHTQRKEKERDIGKF